jgi:hypothetical protein
LFFGNKRISVHILRGILGCAALYGALSTMNSSVWPALILLPAALYLLKGCPMCWTLGLIETIVMAVHKRNERKFPSADFRRSGEESQPALSAVGRVRS